MKISKSVFYKQNCFKNMFIKLKQLSKKFTFTHRGKIPFFLVLPCICNEFLCFICNQKCCTLIPGFFPFAKQNTAKRKSENEEIKEHSGKIMLYKMERINTGTESRTISEYWVTYLQREVLVLTRVTPPKQITWLLAVRWCYPCNQGLFRMLQFPFTITINALCRLAA